MLTELSGSAKKKVMDKFSTETGDPAETISSIIDKFEQIKQSPKIKQRDITRYSYSDLKELVTAVSSEIETSKMTKKMKTIFKKMTPDASDEAIAKIIKYYSEVKYDLPDNIRKFWMADSFQNYEKNFYDAYSRIIKEKLLNKFTNIDKTILLSYINGYINGLLLINSSEKSVLDMNDFREFENFVENNTEFGDFDINVEVGEFPGINRTYEKNGLVIFAPETRDDCIRLRHGKSWCTSNFGVNNMYYSYRLDDELTLYYVIDQDLADDPGNPNYASVVLVEPDGRMRLADGTNSGDFHGGTITPWSVIISKIPKLDGLKHLLVPRKFSEKELMMIREVKPDISRSVPDIIAHFDGNEEKAEAYLEYRQRNLTDEQYRNLPPELKKKFIATAEDISVTKLMDSEPTVITYLLKRRINGIKNTEINKLRAVDIQLLKLQTPAMVEIRKQKINEVGDFSRFAIKDMSNNMFELLLSPELDEFRERMKDEYMEQSKELGDFTDFTILTKDSAHIRFLRMYPDFPLFDHAADNLQFLKINGDGSFIIRLPNDIDRLRNLSGLFVNNAIATIPNTICNIPDLSIIRLENNKRLLNVPGCLFGDREKPFHIFSIIGSPLPDPIQKKVTEACLKSATGSPEKCGSK